MVKVCLIFKVLEDYFHSMHLQDTLIIMNNFLKLILYFLISK